MVLASAHQWLGHHISGAHVRERFYGEIGSKRPRREKVFYFYNN
jgi:hypothetical protein